MLRLSSRRSLAGVCSCALALASTRFNPVLPRGSQDLPGVAYTIQVQSEVLAGTDMAAGMPSATHGYTGHAVFAAHRGRLDIASGGIGPLFNAGDYILFDSTELVIVHPASKTYVAVPPDAANQSIRQLEAMGAKVALRDVKVTLDSVGAGDPIDGFATRHFRMTVAFNMAIDAAFVQQAIGSESVTDYWVASVSDLPGNVLLRASGLSGPPVAAGAFKELSVKVDSAAKHLGGAVALKSVTTNRLIQGPGASMTTRETSNVSDIHHQDVDESSLMLPADYKQAALPGFPPPTSDPGEKWRKRPGER